MTDAKKQDKDKYSTAGAYVHAGEEFNRDTTYIEDRIVADPESAELSEGAQAWPVEAGRYRLVAARACPWANRTLIVRRLLGLEGAISVGLPGPTHDVRSWQFDLDPEGKDPVLGTERLQENYFKRFPDYPRGITVPAIVDIPTGEVVTNNFPQITEDFAKEWTEFHREGAPDLWPADSAPWRGGIRIGVWSVAVINEFRGLIITTTGVEGLLLGGDDGSELSHRGV